MTVNVNRSVAFSFLFILKTYLLLVLGSDMSGDLPTIQLSNDTLQKQLKDYLSAISLDDKLPESVHEVKPHHISVVGAMGDSLTIASRSCDLDSQCNQRMQFPGNSFMTGAADRQLSVYNILKFISDQRGVPIFGGSYGLGYGDNTTFNVAVGGMTSHDLPRQAGELVKRIRDEHKIKLDENWKLVSLWIGTNDLGYDESPPVPAEVYKEKVEEALNYLKENLPRTIVAIVEPCPPQLLLEAESLIDNGTRKGTIEQQEIRTNFTNAYRRVLHEIQNEGKFNKKDFAVVIQPFLSEHKDAYRNKNGDYDKSFYTWDVFHISKLGNAIIARSFWQNLFESIGEKTKKADLSDTSDVIFVPPYNDSFIKTSGNSR